MKEEMLKTPENPFTQENESELLLAKKFSEAKNKLTQLLEKEGDLNERDKVELRKTLNEKVFEIEKGARDFNGTMEKIDNIRNFSKTPEAINSTINLIKEELETLYLLELMKNLIFEKYKEAAGNINDINKNILIEDDENLKEMFLEGKKEKEEDIKNLTGKINDLANKIGFKEEEIKLILDEINESLDKK